MITERAASRPKRCNLKTSPGRGRGNAPSRAFAVKLIRNMRPLIYTLLLAGALASPQATRAQDTVEWLDSYEAALEEAKRTGKPIFLEYRCSP